MNHTIPVSITGGRLPVNTSVQVHSEIDTAGTYTCIHVFTVHVLSIISPYPKLFCSVCYNVALPYNSHYQTGVYT